jgi:hypothetical protein
VRIDRWDAVRCVDQQRYGEKVEKINLYQVKYIEGIIKEQAVASQTPTIQLKFS